MQPIKLLVMDSDVFYLNNLMNYISIEYKDVIKAISFSDKKIFENYIKIENDIDLCLFSKNFYEDLTLNKNDNLNKVILLSEDNKAEGNSIYKFQSIDRICKRIIDIYNKIHRDNSIIEESKIVPFFSPIGGMGTSTISIATAIKLAKNNKKVFYLNLERIQSNGVFMPESKTKFNFSDILISIKEGGEDFDSIFPESIINYNNLNLYYVNTIDSILDIEDISIDDIKELLNRIKNSKLFNYIIIDLPSVLDSKYYYIFEKSEQSILIMGQDVISNYKIDTMLRQLDDISNFQFVLNMYSDKKEKMIPKLISANLLPIISTINLDYDIRGEINIEDILNANSFFNDGISMIINNLK